MHVATSRQPALDLLLRSLTQTFFSSFVLPHFSVQDVILTRGRTCAEARRLGPCAVPWKLMAQR